MSTSLTQELCEHKTDIGCILTALPVCCACADKRPLADAYPVYIDGEGMKMRGKRWARYCWKCRDYYNYLDAETSTLDSIEVSAFPLEHTMAPSHSSAQSQPHQLDPRAEPFTLASNQRSESTMDATGDQSRRASRSQPRPLPAQSSQRRTSSISVPHSHPGNMPSDQSLPQNHPPRPQVFPLGTREDVEQPNYQSPVGLMFSRAYERYQTAEEVRQEAAAMGLAIHSITSGQPALQHAIFSNPQMSRGYGRGFVGADGQLRYLPNPGNPIPNLMPPIGGFRHSVAEIVNPDPPADETDNDNEENAIDRQVNRPTPLSTEDMLVNISCKMCFEQKIDTLIEPCMHLALCRWCSEVWQANARRIRQENPFAQAPWRCPICRRGIQQVRRVYF